MSEGQMLIQTIVAIIGIIVAIIWMINDSKKGDDK